MARTARFTGVVVTGCLAAGLAAGIATGTRGTANPGLPRNEQPGVGALLVGFSVGMLVFVAMRIAYVLRERRLKPGKTYSTRYRIRDEGGLTAQQYLRRLWSLMLGLAALCCLGLWLRLQYG